MSGAAHGRVAPVANHYPEFVVLEALPAGEHELFKAAFEAFIARRPVPLTQPEAQLAWAVGRQMWRECWWACAQARAAEVV